MSGTKITRDLPNNAYEAAVNADNPSATNPFATINDINIDGDTILVSGGSSYSGTGLTFDISVLVFRIVGVEYTTAATQVTLSAGDATNPRFDAIVATLDVNDNPIVEVVEGIPAASPTTPALTAEQVLVQFVQVAAGATVPVVTTEFVYRNDGTSDWTGGFFGGYGTTANFTSSTPSPYAGSACCLSTFGRYGILRGTSFEAPTPITRADYSIFSFRVQLLTDLSSIIDLIYVSAYSEDPSGSNPNAVYLGVLPVHNYIDLTLVGQWQLVNIPVSAWAQNPSETDIGWINFTIHQIGQTLITPVQQLAFDNIQFQSGTVPAPSGPTIDILKNGNNVANTGKLNFIPGTNTTVAVTEDTLNERVDVEISSTGGSSIYSADGTIPFNRLVQIQNGLIWSGSTIFRTTNTRNIKEVIQESDLGSTLAANTTYVIRGKVTVSNPITVANAGTEVVGLNRDVDEIEWTGAGNLFFVTDQNFTLANLKLSATTAGSNILAATNIAATGYNFGRDKVLTLTNCQFRGTYNVMTIEGFDLVDISQCLFFYVKATSWGLRFRDVSKLQISSCELIRWFDETKLPTPLPADFATTDMITISSGGIAAGFGAVNINGCIIHPQETQNGISISAGTTTGFGTISSNAFVNTGLSTGEVFLPIISAGLPDYSQPHTIAYDIFANQGVLNSLSGCVMTFVGNTNDCDLTQNVPIPIETDGLAVAQAAVRFTVSAAGRATYTGSKQIYVSLHGTLAYEKLGGGSDDYTFHFFKNGVVLPGSTTTIRGGGDSKELSTSLTYGTLMNQNDYIEIYVENTSSDDDLLVKDLQLVIRE